MTKILSFVFLTVFIFVLFLNFFFSPVFHLNLSLSELRQSISYRIFPEISNLQKEGSEGSITRSSGEFKADYKAFFDNKQVPTLQSDFIARTKDGVLAASTGQEKWIEVDLSNQRLYAWEGGSKVMGFVISSGKPWTPTIEGEYRIWIKLRYHTMEGGSRVRGDYYRLPNVPYVMYFYRGYGIHGTYWHNNFGRPMSHGCVNLRIPDAQKLFLWTDPQLPGGKSVILASSEIPGTRVVVHR